MRILLVYSNQTKDLIAAPPIGLSYVASATRNAGHDVRFLDLMVSRNPMSDLETALVDYCPQVVGISVRNIDNVVHQRLAHHFGQLAQMLAMVRKVSTAKIVLGGPAISVLSKTALACLDADFAVLGEGEITFPELLSAIEAGHGEEGIPGVVYRNNGRITATGPARLPSFGASGMEHWVRWKDYERRGATWAIQTKRGCPMHCSYCAYPSVEGRAMRRRSATDVVDEIQRVSALIAPRTFEFVDSTFNLPAEHSAEICREIIRRGLRVNLTAMGVNPLNASQELFSLMRQAGFNSMMITPEAASDTMLRNLRKGFTMEHVRRSAELAQRSGISSTWFFMLGGPGETRETVEETVSFVEEHLRWKNCLSIFMTGIRVLPGTQLAREAIAEGTLSEEQNFADSVFYFSPKVSEAWMLRRINKAVARHPNIVHAAEEGGSAYERLFHKTLHLLGVAPPYWRFLPAFLRFPPLPTLRKHFPPIGRKCARTS